jgi:hypothetical protein
LGFAFDGVLTDSIALAANSSALDRDGLSPKTAVEVSGFGRALRNHARIHRIGIDAQHRRSKGIGTQTKMKRGIDAQPRLWWTERLNFHPPMST